MEVVVLQVRVQEGDLADLFNILTQGIPLNFLKINNNFVLDDPFNIPHIGLLDTFFIKVDSPLPEVIFPHKVNHVRILQTQILEKETDSVRSDLVIDQKLIFGEVVNPKALLGFFRCFSKRIAERVVKGGFGLSGIGVGFGRDKVEVILFREQTVVFDGDWLLVQLDYFPLVA